MTTKDKRQPAFTDLDLMPFGKHKGEALQDVPARYLAWLWRDGLSDFSVNNGHGERVLLANYIWNSKSAIEQEAGESL